MVFKVLDRAARIRLPVHCLSALPGQSLASAVSVLRVGASSYCLRTLTSLNKEVTLFFQSDNGIWSLPSDSSLSDCKASLQDLQML